MSSDGARSWHTRDTGLPQARVEALSQDPIETNRLWVAAADRVFASDNQGENWHSVGQPLPEANTFIHGIAAAEEGKVIVLTTHRGLFRSTDSGHTWVLVEDNLPIHLEAGPLVWDPTDPTTLYVGFSLTPYNELWKIAIEGGSLLNRIDPVSLAGGAAFLILLIGLGITTARWLARSRNATVTKLAQPQIKETLR
jgi:hypothetical protein